MSIKQAAAQSPPNFKVTLLAFLKPPPDHINVGDPPSETTTS